MLSPLSKAAITTSVMIIASIFFRTKFTKWMIVFFIFFFGMTYYLESTEYDEDDFEPINWEHFDQNAQLTSKQRAEYVEKINFHEANAKRTYEDAKSRCWWLPEMDARVSARNCINIFIASFCTNHPMSKAVAMLVCLLDKYAVSCNDEWDYINMKLRWSEYHWEMKEFYEMLLIKG